MKYQNAGLSLCYGNDDAPVPANNAATRQGLSVNFAVQPINPSNRAELRYRVDGGAAHTIPAILTHNDYPQQTQYYRAQLPDFQHGDRVDYIPVVYCAGRQVPAVDIVNSLPNSFRLPAVKPSLPKTAIGKARSSESQFAQGRFPFRLDYLCTVTVQLSNTPEIIGTTPEGLRVNWYVTGGVVSGPKLNATVRPVGGDWMTIRRDGIGDVDVRATFETDDGALLYLTTSGYFELGEDGYQNFIDRKWPSTPGVHSAPRFLTAAPQYQWLNRLQCLGVGEVRMAELVVCYDVYAVQYV